MIRTKIAFTTFLILIFVVFPYSIVLFWSDFACSIIPGWRTTIFPESLIATCSKLLTLIFVVIGYWRLSKKNPMIPGKLFFFHLMLTIPAIAISKFSLLLFVDLNLGNMEKLFSDFYVITYLAAFINILFFIGQILFLCYYIKSKTRLTANKG